LLRPLLAEDVCSFLFVNKSSLDPSPETFRTLYPSTILVLLSYTTCPPSPFPPRRETMSIEMNPTTGLRVDLFGPTMEFLTSPQERSIDFCVLRGVIPPGVSVPLHSHPDTEDFFVISGEVQALRQGTQGYECIVVKTGDHLHVPSGARHGWRNVSSEPLVAFIITTTRLGQFFQEVGRPVVSTPQPVTAEDLAHYETVSAKYGYWNASPEENAAVGIRFQLSGN
jgi:quercetin dioxygenase-like cupin family protein